MAESPALRSVPVAQAASASANAAASWPIALLGASPQIGRVRRWLEGLASLRAPVLLVGEAGSGRLVAARWLHDAGTLPEAAFEVLDAARVQGPTTLPIRGTVVLRGLEDLDADAQHAWLPRLGARGSGVRFLATAGPDFAERVRSGRFDPRLAAVFSRFELGLPALRDRRDDLPTLVDAQACAVAGEFGRPKPRFTAGALRRLACESWLGNLADLRRVVERLCAFCSSGDVTAADVDALLEETRPSVEDLRRRQRHAERESLLRHLEETGGNVAQTAQRMGRSRPAIYRLVDKYGISLR